MKKHDAKAILQKYITGLTEKAARGETLTAEEVERLREFQAPQEAPEWVNNFTELGQWTNHPRDFFSRMKKKYSDTPPDSSDSRKNVPAWLDWLAEHDKEIALDESAVDNKETLSDYRLKKLKEECRKITMANDVEAGIYIEKQLVCGLLSRLGAELVGLFRQKLENEYPATVAGMEPAQVRVIGKRLADDLCERMQKAVEHWTV